MPIILLEGADGVGKSTLAEMCLDRFEAMEWDAHLEHFGVPKYDPEAPGTIGDQAMQQLMERIDYYSFGNTALVLDRFHWGEPAYAPVFRPERCVSNLYGTLTHQEFWVVQNWCWRVGAVIAYVENDLETMTERLGLRGDEELLSDDEEKRVTQLKEIVDNYEDLISLIDSHGMPYVRVKLDKMDDTVTAASELVDRALAEFHIARERGYLEEDMRPPTFPLPKEQ